MRSNQQQASSPPGWRDQLEKLFKPVAVSSAPDGDLDLGERTGTVRRFSEEKGYGFIIDDEHQDHFVHFRDIRAKGYRNLATGQRVAFHAFAGPNGLFARDVRVVTS
jgi:CspA family cold shock protein